MAAIQAAANSSAENGAQRGSWQPPRRPGPGLHRSAVLGSGLAAWRTREPHQPGHPTLLSTDLSARARKMQDSRFDYSYRPPTSKKRNTSPSYGIIFTIAIPSQGAARETEQAERVGLPDVADGRDANRTTATIIAMTFNFFDTTRGNCGPLSEAAAVPPTLSQSATVRR